MELDDLIADATRDVLVYVAVLVILLVVCLFVIVLWVVTSDCLN